MYSFRRLSAIQVILLVYIILILSGAGILYLPISQQSGVHINLLNCLFTATSAFTLTGLITVSTADSWSIFGKVVLLILIQLGGLVYVSAATYIALKLGLRLGLHNRLQLPSAVQGYNSRHDIWRITGYAIRVMFVFEAAGMFFLAGYLYFNHLVPQVEDAFFSGLFYSISSFCNAGFDLSPGFSGFTTPGLQNHIGFLAIIGILVLCGGLGIGVLAELSHWFSERRFSLHSKLALMMSALLILFGASLLLLFQFDAGHNLFSRIANAIFVSINSRSAGFSPIDMASLSPPTLFMLTLLMFVGGAAGGTAGGVKITTVTVISLAIITLLRRKSDIEVFHRRISGEMVRLALSLAIISFIAVMTLIIGISVTEITLKALPQGGDASLRFIKLVFEVFGAFGNVGFRTGLTPTLEPFSRILLMIAMLLGRVGPLAFIYIFSQSKKPTLRRLPTESLMAG